MPITEFLEKNAREYPNDICLVEINPEVKEHRRVTWKEYDLMMTFQSVSVLQIPMKRLNIYLSL